MKTICASCDTLTSKTYNVDYCSPACVMVGEMSLQILAHNLIAGGRP